MKSFTKFLGILLISVSFLFAGSAVAQPRWGGGGQKDCFGPHHGKRDGGVIHMQLREYMYNASIEVAAELSGQPVETIREKLKTKPLPSVLEDLDLDRQEFHTKMRDKMPQIIQQAAEQGKITQEQAQIMLERHKNAPDSEECGNRRGHRRFFR